MGVRFHKISRSTYQSPWIGHGIHLPNSEGELCGTSGKTHDSTMKKQDAACQTHGILPVSLQVLCPIDWPCPVY